jgi:hypothetical protein
MEITITINGKPVQATVDDAVIREAMGEKKEKKTGYERESKLNDYYFISSLGGVDSDVESNVAVDDSKFYTGNYFTCKKVAENNARADALMRNLRRFAAEHGGCGKPGAAAYNGAKNYDWTVSYVEGVFQTKKVFPNIGAILFKDEDAANAAIDAFRDELMWYFTEYDPMPEGWWDE